MQKFIFHFTCLAFLFVGLQMNAQLIKGVVFDQKRKSTLPGATVYQDGTTNVTMTDFDGAFTLNSKGSESPLVVTYIGYNTTKVDQPLKYLGKSISLYLDEEPYSLDEVVVGNKSPFTRREMLRAFREQFLGTSKVASRCKILNEDDVLLTYDVSKKTLTATSRKPLKIMNNYLDYEVNFDLVELVVAFNSMESLAGNLVNNSFFSGYSFYADLAKNTKVNKRRIEIFYGSTAHFMQALAYGKMEEEKWELYVSKFRVNPETYFKITDTANLKKITLIKKPERLVKLNLNENIVKDANGRAIPIKVNAQGMVSRPEYFVPFYARKEQSLMEFLEPIIYVDENGNFSPIYAVVFGGSLGALKAGDLLPTDYYQTIKELQKSQKTN